jgi:uncharacterized protein (UPF0332 family)
MLFSPDDFERIADEIRKKIKDRTLEEAKTRTIVSRMYYSCFLNAREKLLSCIPPEYKEVFIKGIFKGKQINVHYIVRETFKSSQDKMHQKIGEGLEVLRKRRNEADYNISAILEYPELELIRSRLLNQNIKNVENTHELVKSFRQVLGSL